MKKRLSYNVRLFIVTASALVALLPVIFVFLNSFMSAEEAGARYTSLITPLNILGVTDGFMHYMEPAFLPDVLTFSAYRRLLIYDPIHLRFLWNSLILAVPIVLGQLVIAPLAAYGFEMAKSKYKERLFFAYIITMLMPMQALLVPHFITARYMGIDGSYLAIIIPAIFGSFGVFLIRQQLRGFDKNLIEAARVDGASEIRVFLRIVLPNIKPTMTALAVLAFSEAWNIVDQAIVFIRDQWQMPMSTYLSVSFTGDIGMVFAISTLFMIPALIIFIYGQDHLSEGIGYSGVR
jgi:multiple sugar transport system permease protein